MSREPIGLIIFKYLLFIALVAFMGMLYWSSTLVEDRLAVLQTEISEVRKDIALLQEDREKNHTDLEKTFGDISGKREIEASSSRLIPKPTLQTAKNKSPHPNLVQEDPFYAKTLPKLLGKSFVPSGRLHSAVIAKPNNLHPFSNWSQVSAWHSMCSVTAAKNKFGIFESFAPFMANRIEERINAITGAPEYWVFLRDDVFWHPLKSEFFPDGMELAPMFFKAHQVTAEDYKFFFDAMMNPYVQEPQAVALRTYYRDLQEIEIVDKLTMVVRWKPKMVPGLDGKSGLKLKYISKELTGQLKPLASFVYQYFPDGRKILDDDLSKEPYRTNSVWAQNFAEHWAKNIIVSCGPWIFEGMGDRGITFKRNPDFYSPYLALSSSMEIAFKASPDNVWQDFKSNRLDTYELPPSQLLELANFLESDQYQKQKKKGSGINRLDYVARSYAYIGWNEAKPYFKSENVRQAMTMAIDRQRIIEQNLNGMGVEITGPFYRYSPSYNLSISPFPFDPDKAKRLLEEDGWFDADGDGVIDKLIDGKRVPFAFSLTYYVKNPTSKSICEYVSTALKEIGVDCALKGVDIADLSASLDDKSFDAIFMGWALGAPPEDPRQLWDSSGAKEKGSSNSVGFVNREIDEIINQLEYEYDKKTRIALYHRFHEIIHQEQPYTFLYTPKIALLYRDYVKNVFIPADRQDLVPGANIAEPDPSVFWLEKRQG